MGNSSILILQGNILKNSKCCKEAFNFPYDLWDNPTRECQGLNLRRVDRVAHSKELAPGIPEPALCLNKIDF